MIFNKFRYLTDFWIADAENYVILHRRVPGIQARSFPNGQQIPHSRDRKFVSLKEVVLVCHKWFPFLSGVVLFCGTGGSCMSLPITGRLCSYNFHVGKAGCERYNNIRNKRDGVRIWIKSYGSTIFRRRCICMG